MNIGIVLRKNKNSNLKDIYSINKEIFDIIKKHDGHVIGIYDIDSIKLCDGIILQGGDDIDYEELNIIKYLYDNDIPTLGICLGMQQMAVSLGGSIKEINNFKHLSNNKYVHDINIDPLSKLYKIIKKDKIKVNSRHKDKIDNTSLEVVAYSSDGIIEAIEDKSKKFFIGVQWHPESLNDENSDMLFTSFFNSLNV